ncbi:hypothetical protein GLOIN_2v1779851 [Rhizophagus irregularis DAOM 181602=DAOM 197198]|nr:hypothetical protein GLOIN_2v1779851 [Rhizophagus irregularis DAOM 181602=DAOM 197198]
MDFQRTEKGKPLRFIQMDFCLSKEWKKLKIQSIQWTSKEQWKTKICFGILGKSGIKIYLVSCVGFDKQKKTKDS